MTSPAGAWQGRLGNSIEIDCCVGLLWNLILLVLFIEKLCGRELRLCHCTCVHSITVDAVCICGNKMITGRVLSCMCCGEVACCLEILL